MNIKAYDSKTDGTFALADSCIPAGAEKIVITDDEGTKHGYRLAGIAYPLTTIRRTPAEQAKVDAAEAARVATLKPSLEDRVAALEAKLEEISKP
jgi:hypothetical protein